MVLGNVVKRFDDIPDRWEAARVGTSEVAVAVLASAGTNVVVMLPITMTSMVGRFFAPFAGTTLIVNAASILVSFTLTPILCALIMRPASQRKQNWATRFGGRWVDFVQRYGRLHAVILRRIIERRWLAALIVLGGILLFVGTLKICGQRSSMGFVENNDYGKIFVRLEFPPYYDLEHTVERVHEIEKLFEPLQDRLRTFSLVGRAEAHSGQANQGVYLAMIILLFTDKTESRLDDLRSRGRSPWTAGS